ncbi:type II secretion system protein [Rhodoferax sp.]|uniref:type II secretion system protein n=1 Tax=Rhodoferax sp. TaxID=50421 RepID=UPI002846A96A|nr:type II secretion system protein [Rhodoferax sp.]MDR3370145.1 type II secretion system protein [Rhodoferax sp.]
MQRRTYPSPAQRVSQQHGFLLMGILVIMVLAGIALMAAVEFWTVQRQREREQQLLFVGDAYRQAIRHYYFGAPPGSPRKLPTSLNALLDDDRYPMPVHHLRRLYPDPITGKTEWGELRVGDVIAGVFSLSEVHPIKQAGFSLADASFDGKTSYRDWEFVFTQAPGVAGAMGKVDATSSTSPAAFSSQPDLGNTK